MLRTSGLVGAALLALLSTAQAAPAYTWTGLYLGAHAGYGSGRNTFPQNSDENHNFKGGLGGVQFGWNYQFAGNFVAGFEGSLSRMQLTGSTIVDFAPPPFGVQSEGTRAHQMVLLGGRLGYAFDNILVYANGGHAHMKFTGWFNDATGKDSARNARDGWFIGGGVEYAFAPNWTVKLEYNRFDFGTSEWSFGVPRPANVKAQRVIVGLNYLFNPMAPSGPLSR